MAYRLGVDVGGTFTDVLLIDEEDSSFHVAKVPSTPADSSIGVLNGIARVCELADIRPGAIQNVMHGNHGCDRTRSSPAGARVSAWSRRKAIGTSCKSPGPSFPAASRLGHLQQDAASRAPGADRRSARADRRQRRDCRDTGRGRAAQIAAVAQAKGNRRAHTISLINSYTNDSHEKIAGRIAAEELPDIPISLSSQVIPEMQEYERTITTVCNSYVRPIVSRYVRNLSRELGTISGDVKPTSCVRMEA